MRAPRPRLSAIVGAIVGLVCLWTLWIAIYLVTTATPGQVSFDGTFDNRFGGSVAGFDRADKLMACAGATLLAAAIGYLVSRAAAARHARAR